MSLRRVLAKARPIPELAPMTTALMVCRQMLVQRILSYNNESKRTRENRRSPRALMLHHTIIPMYRKWETVGFCVKVGTCSSARETLSLD